MNPRRQDFQSRPWTSSRRGQRRAVDHHLCVQKLGQPVNVVNMPGASGITSTGQVLNSKPDGHTLLMDVHATASMLFAVQSDVPFRMEDKTPSAWSRSIPRSSPSSPIRLAVLEGRGRGRQGQSQRFWQFQVEELKRCQPLAIQLGIRKWDRAHPSPTPGAADASAVVRLVPRRRTLFGTRLALVPGCGSMEPSDCPRRDCR